MSANASPKARYAAANNQLQELFPQVYKTIDDSNDFISLFIKLRDDGTCLAVAKEFGSDGRPMVVFGSGYGVAGCLLGLEGAIAANKWRPDTPIESKS